MLVDHIHAAVSVTVGVPAAKTGALIGTPLGLYIPDPRGSVE